MLVCCIVLGMVACGHIPRSSSSPLTSTTASVFKPSMSPSTKRTVPTTIPTTAPTTAPTIIPTTAPTTAPTDPSDPADDRIEAPDFTVYDCDGNPVKLSDFLGKPVVLNFWATWCGPCQAEMPDFQEAYEKYGNQIQFMMVNVTDGATDTPTTAAAFIQQQGYSFPFFCDSDYSALYAYGVETIPRTFFITADGYVGAWYSGMLDAEILETGIQMILP